MSRNCSGLLTLTGHSTQNPLAGILSEMGMLRLLSPASYFPKKWPVPDSVPRPSKSKEQLYLLQLVHLLHHTQIKSIDVGAASIEPYDQGAVGRQPHQPYAL